MPIKPWITAMRLRTLPVSVSGVLAAIAYAQMSCSMDWLPAVLCLVFAVLAQIASNFANEYYDYRDGLDKPGRVGPRRGVTEGDISPRAMLIATVVTLAVACAVGLSLVAWGGWWLLAAGALIAVGVFAYSAGPYPLSRHGWGETAVLFFFGIIPVCLSYYVITGWCTLSVAIGSIAIGLLGANVLIINNYRDADDDAAVGKRTMAVIYGRAAMPALYLANGWIAVIAMLPAWLSLGLWALVCPLVYLIIHTINWNHMKRLNGTVLNKYLGITAIAMLCYAAMFVIAAFCGTSCSSSQAKSTHVQWQMIGNNADNTYSHRLVITGDTDFDMLAYNSLPSQTRAMNPGDTVVEIIPGYYAIASSRFDGKSDTVIVDLVTRGFFRNIAYAPDSFHKVYADQSTAPVEFEIMAVTEPSQWLLVEGAQRMPMGEEIYAINEAIRPQSDAPVYATVPSYKSVELLPGESKELNYVYKAISDPRPEYYTLTVRNDSLIVAANDERTARNMAAAFQTKHGHMESWPNVYIEDYPDYPYRALMIDIARNYQSPATMHRILDNMRDYRLNVLHFHIVDDEAWRLEMPSFPELTAVGGRRGYTLDDSEFLAQVYSGNGNPNADVPTANGFFTRQDFISLLQHADSLGITVIAEIESPGHARAAVRAMEHRYRTTGDDSFRLIHDGDSSTYTSAQSYHDNVMNPALESTYRFMDAVIGDLCDMYAEAGVSMPALHIGGDEVAKGAWDGSSAAQQFIADNGLDGQTGLHGYFVRRIAKMLADRGVKVSGWQEIAMDHSPEYDAEMIPKMYGINCWHNTGAMQAAVVSAAQKGYPIVLCNVDHYYLDQCYNYHVMENGLTWGGVVDELQSLHGYPMELCPISGDAAKNVIGVSGQLFAETIRSPQQLDLYIFPKMLGLAERGWNGQPTYSDNEFMAVIEDHEMPLWQKGDKVLSYHVRQPGIHVEEGMIYMNSPYRGGEIRYTTDGSMPSTDSPLYAGPIALDGATDIRAVQYLNGKPSLCTYWLADPMIIVE